MQNSCFGQLPRDLAVLVFAYVHSFSFLLSLKSVSRSTANAVRRTICSGAFFQDDDEFVRYTDMSYALDKCSLTLPLRVEYSHNLRECTPVAVLIVHEFHLIFRDECMELVTDTARVFDWIAKMVEHNNAPVDRHLTVAALMTSASRKENEDRNSIHVEAIRFCVEWEGVGIFTSSQELYRHLSLEEYQRNLHKDYKNRGETMHTSDLWAVSQSETDIELAVRLFPIARFGDKFFQIQASKGGDGGGWNHSLLYHFLYGRLTA
jgi:hypothetical protein